MVNLPKLADELSSLSVLEATELAKLLKERWRPPNVTVLDIKHELPAWPDDVINQWLHYFANEPDLGWPPPDPLGSHRWGRILGGRPLSWWRDVSWKKEKVNCGLAGLSEKSKSIVTSMITEVNNGTADESTLSRFNDAFQYILHNVAFPKPIITMRVPSGLNVLDGNHRMGAFCALQLMPDKKFEQLKMKKAAPEQEVWVGTHSLGEVPLT